MRRGRVNVQFAEAAAERKMLRGRDVLVAKEDHEIFGERAMDFIHLPVRALIVGDEPADIDAGNLGADDRGELFDRDGFVRLALVCEMLVARPLFSSQRTHGVFSQSLSVGIIVARSTRSAMSRLKWRRPAEACGSGGP